MGWIKSSIKHPGRETKRAEKHGVSVHEQMEKDSHSSNSSLRKAGELGLRLSKMNKKRKGGGRVEGDRPPRRMDRKCCKE
jgi:hypothetical protein